MSRTLYNCRTSGSGWMMAKFDRDFNVAAVYTITTRDEKPQMVCDCPGWPRKSICKHTRMVSIFDLAGAIDTDQFYCYETQTWHQPIRGPWDSENDPTAEKAHAISMEDAFESGVIKFVDESPLPTTVSPTQFRRRV